MTARKTINVAGGPTPTSVTLDGFDFNGDAMTFSIAVAPTKGNMALVSGNQFTYTPTGTTATTDSFTYIATDSHGVSSPATLISVNVAAQ